MTHATDSTDFATLALPEALARNLDSLGYHTMTPVQAASLPPALSGRDVRGQGKTGSGKTAAFGLALLARLDVARFRVQTLVLCPTRELADQVAEEIRRLARQMHNVKVLTLCGGAPIGPQLHSLEHGAHIIVGTPGRVEQHLRKGSLSLDHLTMFVLDEADRMLDMGFEEALDAIIDDMPRTRQTLLFSATFDAAITPLADRLLTNPAIIEVESTHSRESIEQHIYALDSLSRFEALVQVLLHYRPSNCVVFCNTRAETQKLAEDLAHDGFSAKALHGDLDQRERDQTLIQFSNDSVSILVATDVAARGLDIDALEAVINYQLASDLDVHTHRIGRTGRAGGKGVACTLISDRERMRLLELSERLGQELEPEPLPRPDASSTPFPAPMATLELDAGKKQKIRPGDLVGALTNAEYGHALDANQLGKIKVTARASFVAVDRRALKQALKQLQSAPLKGRRVRARVLS
ncbi:ATP-dependent RNA helicase DbpA [Larsenimonas salina]|uniref:ATP-dependent RNA helicase DbpA n=1 Tax=Larsenimonas salina TaxID=1295565 RepID=UPI002072F306|nr:ATP-dependent RNA helicase DbpA [Larsenimonas salina]